MNKGIQQLEYPIIVHSHLGWDWVWQRPQQFFSRLSERHPVLFVEGPIPKSGIATPTVEIREVSEYPNILVIRMAMPQHRWSDGDWVDNQRRRLVQEVLAGPLGERFSEPVQWFYDPMAVTAFAGRMKERAIVFDCMDQLSQFRGVPDTLVARERKLLEMADVVFAGGPKLGKEKRKINPNTYVYGCGVDVDHFGKAMLSGTVIPKEIARLTKPVFGFFGVVDERMDYELVTKLADMTPYGNVVIIGPSTKVDPTSFPHRENLHWLGGFDYDLLPNYARGFDVCLVPFALNEATEYINPTKVLEYLATGRPVVSTVIEDVVLQFSKFVKIAGSHEEFIRLCQREAFHPDQAAIQGGIDLGYCNTWEAVISNLERNIEDFLASGKNAPVVAV
jgi:glycosyltransferase involved in cell wall biosynthesis